MKTIYYFGTDTQQAGHYMWEFIGDRTTVYKGLTGFNELPFDPESMAKDLYENNRKVKGMTKFYSVTSPECIYSIWFIEGSPIDKRWGTKSVFWVKEQVTPEQLKELILSTPTARRIIYSMPFSVKW